ncbi:MAG: transcriptional regulator [Pusillimonas sp.]|nr:transcriptional regulator [Pusillimonas sp.]MBC42362.1 transcriptional regulator [Pusillimonas sp.]HCP78021.1 transcriptional regulator [Pusillimonas sp.]|tara:strand:- start:9240 stop:9641 length:402 start_codon:yes stop_codon:yes gene_type:complete
MKSDIGRRLKEERERLGLSQAQLAKLAGTSPRTQIAWEQGEQTPNALYLAIAGQEGMDVQYVVSGRKSINAEQVQDEIKMVLDAFQALDEALNSAGKTMPPDKKRLAAEALYHAVKSGDGEAVPLAKLLIKAA